LVVDFLIITGTGQLKYYNPDFDNGVGGWADGPAFGVGDSNTPVIWDFTANKDAHGIADDQGDQNDSWTIEEINSYLWGLKCDADSSAQIKNIYLSLIELPILGTVTTYERVRRKRRGLRRVETLSEFTKVDRVCSNAYGTNFESWIDADARNNGYNEGNLIEHGAYQIESILRDELGLTSSEINYQSFDDVGNTTDGHRKDWKFACVIDEETNSLEVIKKFCQQAGIVYFQNYENKEKVAPLKKQTAVKTIDRTTIQEGPIKVRFSELGNVFNEFYLNYDKLWVTDNYRKTLYVTGSSNNLSSNARSGTPNTYTGLCSDSQSKYNITRRLIIDCEAINDDATAELLIKWLAEWHCYRKHIVPFESAGLEHIDLELGDQIKIDHTLLPTGVSNDDSFFIYEVSPNLDNDRIKFECMQMPELLP